MRLLLIVGLVFGTVGNTAGQTTSAKQGELSAVEQQGNTLKLSVVATKQRVRRTDKLELLVMLSNPGKKDLFVFGTMNWGYTAGLLFQIRDASGKAIHPMAFPDDQTYLSQGDDSAFVRLAPNHFLGTDFFAPLDILNMNKPGKYAIFVEYRSPISTVDIELKPFFSKESGTIKSNVVWIEVVR